MSYLMKEVVDRKKTPQGTPVSGRQQVENYAGGYVFPAGTWTHMRRFLILGTEGGTYYASQKALTLEASQSVLACLGEDAQRAISLIAEVSEQGLAIKQDTCLYALAIALSHPSVEVRRAAAAGVPRIVRTASHLFMLLSFATKFRGWGPLLRKVVADWYNTMPADKLVYQLIKYRQRYDWTHRKAVLYAHPKPVDSEHDWLYDYVMHGKVPEYGQLQAFEAVQTETDKSRVLGLVREHNLPWEALPDKWLTEKDVWAAMLPDMPMTALVRNLARLSAIGLLTPLSLAAKTVCDHLGNAEHVHKARVHPLTLLFAMETYASGNGLRGSLQWQPVAQVIDALESAFYAAFANVESTGKRYVLGLDVSSSMDIGSVGGSSLTPREAVGAMAMVTARTESQHVFMAFSDKPVSLSISRGQRLDDVCHAMKSIPMGATDCALPMLWAMEQHIPADVFVIYTDGESWAGKVHPFQALRRYRHQMGIAAKCVIVGMTSTGFTLADPSDAGMLDVVGFSPDVPEAMRLFVLEQ